jgi:hypothetical protein
MLCRVSRSIIKINYTEIKQARGDMERQNLFENIGERFHLLCIVL